MSAATDPVYPFSAPPPPGTPFEVTPGVYWLRMPLPFALNHINLWVLDGPKGLTLVDTGYALDEVKTAWRQALDQLAKPVERIVVTHFHPDHLGLADWLQQQTGAPVAISMGEYLTAQAIWHQNPNFSGAFMLEFFRCHGLSEDACQALERRGNAYRHGVPSIPRSYERLLDGQTLLAGNQHWTTVVGRGHAVEHMALYAAEAQVLISGDMLLPRITSNVTVFAQSPLDDTLAQYLASVDRFTELPENTLVLPAHGLPFRNLHGRVQAIHAHHTERLALLEAACDQPRTAAECLPVLFGRNDFDAHQNMFAMGEAIAHFNHLVASGRLVRQVEEGGVIRFVRPPV